MNCRNHPTRAAVNTCSQCGDWLCEECTADVGGRIYCAACLQKYWAHDHADAAPAAAPPYYAPRSERPRYISFGLLLFFSLLPPGINYMYEGLIKRGLFILSGFTLLCYLAGAFNAAIFGLMIPVLCVTCVFDAFRIRRRLNAGENVPDSVDDILGFIRKYKMAIILCLAVILGLNMLNLIGGSFIQASAPYLRMHARAIRSILPLLILFGGVYFIILSGKRSSRRHHKDSADVPGNK